GTAVREKLGRLVVENEVMRANGIRALATLADGRAPGPESSLEKLYWSEFDKRFRETALDLLGPGGQLLRTSPAARADVDWALEALGRACLRGPYLGVVPAATLLAGAGGHVALLADLSAGRTIVTLAREEGRFAGGRGRPAGFEAGRVRGTKYFVPFAAEADA